MQQPARDMTKYFNGERGPDERRVQPGQEKRTFEVSELWEVHHEIVRRLLLGQKNADIARDLGISRQMVSYVRNSPVVRDKLELMKGARDAETIDLAKRIRDNAPRALKLLEDIIEGEVDGNEVPLNMRRQEANMMMNRAGYSPVTNIKGTVAHAHYTKDDIEDIKRRAVETGLKTGAIVDADFEEVKHEEVTVGDSASGDAADA
jgi:hypothetical protein